MNGTEVMCSNGHANARSSAFCSSCGQRLMQLVAQPATSEVGGLAGTPPPPRRREEAPPPPPPRSDRVDAPPPPPRGSARCDAPPPPPPPRGSARCDAPPPPPPRSDRADAPPPPPGGGRRTFGFGVGATGPVEGVFDLARASWAGFSPRGRLATVLATIAIIAVIAVVPSSSSGSSYGAAAVQAVMSQCEGAGNSPQSCQCVVNHVESVLSPAQFHDSVVEVTPAGESAFGAADQLCGVSG
jgi:hypothetical protein